MSQAPQTTQHALRSSMPLVARCFWLFGPALILALSFLLRTGDGRSVLIPGSKIVLPETCYTHRIFGWDCPGCGLTRSFIHISQGDWQKAWQLNPMSFVLYTYLVLQIPQALLRWLSTQQRQRWLCDAKLAKWTRFNEWALIGIMVGLVFQWILRLIGRAFA